MVVLKNDEQNFNHQDFIGFLQKIKETDCILFSQEGTKFTIHKEVLVQTKLMRNILKSAIGMDYQELEIFCPCSENELESIVDFLYKGQISDEIYDIANIQDNLIKIFSFPERLLSVEDRGKYFFLN